MLLTVAGAPTANKQQQQPAPTADQCDWTGRSVFSRPLAYLRLEKELGFFRNFPLPPRGESLESRFRAGVIVWDESFSHPRRKSDYDQLRTKRLRINRVSLEQRDRIGA